MKTSKCIVQSVHIPTIQTDPKEMSEQLELLLAKLICANLNDDYAEYQVV